MRYYSPRTCKTSRIPRTEFSNSRNSSRPRCRSDLPPAEPVGQRRRDPGGIPERLRRGHVEVAREGSARSVVLRGLAALEDLLQDGEDRRLVAVLRVCCM